MDRNEDLIRALVSLRSCEEKQEEDSEETEDNCPEEEIAIKAGIGIKSRGSGRGREGVRKGSEEEAQIVHSAELVFYIERNLKLTHSTNRKINFESK